MRSTVLLVMCSTLTWAGAPERLSPATRAVLETCGDLSSEVVGCVTGRSGTPPKVRVTAKAALSVDAQGHLLRADISGKRLSNAMQTCVERVVRAAAWPTTGQQVDLEHKWEILPK